MFSFGFLILSLLLLISALAWVGGRYFLGWYLPLPSWQLPRARWLRLQAWGLVLARRAPGQARRGAQRLLRALGHRSFHSKTGMVLFSASLIACVVGLTLEFKTPVPLQTTTSRDAYGQRIMQSFADETLAPAAPLPPAVFTSSVTRQSICPVGHSNCDLSAQLNSYFAAAARRYDLEPALLAAIQQCEAPMNQPAIVGPAPAEGDLNDRAIGLMQIRQSIARKLGLDPTNPEQSIFGAALLLAQSLKRNHGNLAMAVT